MASVRTILDLVKVYGHWRAEEALADAEDRPGRYRKAKKRHEELLRQLAGLLLSSWVPSGEED